MTTASVWQSWRRYRGITLPGSARLSKPGTGQSLFPGKRWAGPKWRLHGALRCYTEGPRAHGAAASSSRTRRAGLTDALEDSSTALPVVAAHRHAAPQLLEAALVGEEAGA